MKKALLAAVSVVGVVAGVGLVAGTAQAQDPVPVKETCQNTGEVNNGTSTREGFPTDETTGPEAGGVDEDTMQPSGVDGRWSISEAGAVIDGVYHNGTVEVNANDVTIRNSVICGTSTHIIRNNGSNLVIENSIIRGETGTVSKPETGEPCGATIAYGNYTIRNSELTNCADAGKAGGVVEIHDSWMHDNYSNRFGGGSGTHNDTMQTAGGKTERLVFQGNSAYQDPCTSNAHFQLAPTEQPGNIGVLRIQDNFFYGITGVNMDRGQGADDGLISGNTWAGSASQGPFNHGSLYRGDSMGSAERSGNVFESGESADDNSGNYTCVEN